MIAWEAHVDDYLRLRRQLGFTLVWDEHLLGQFTTHLNAAGARLLTTTAMIEKIKRTNPRFDINYDDFPLNTNANCTVPHGSPTGVRDANRAALSNPIRSRGSAGTR